MKRIISLTAAVLCLLVYIPASAAGYKGSDELSGIANGIIDWKKLDNGVTDGGTFFNDKFLSLAGTTPGDWYPIGMSRLGIAENYDRYLAVLKAEVEKRYGEENKLSASKATEWHRISLAVLAAGGDPTNFGRDKNGNPINLIADGTYDRGKTVSLGRQGINGWIWGLIALDSMYYEIPNGSFYSRDDIITEILCRQLSDGGFALTGKTADPDITAMAVQALAPYYNSGKSYTYQLKSEKKQVSRTVKQIVNEALSCLSLLQTEDGDFMSWGTQNAESTAQAAAALCSLNIDPQKDSRFIKNGKTLLDGILKYRMPDGGFTHSYAYDKDNPSSKPGKSNSMAGEQVLYALAAVIRQQRGQSPLYNFGRYTAVKGADKASVADNKTAASAAEADKKPAAADGKTPRDDGKTAQDTKGDMPILYFSASDREAADKLPSRLTTEQYVTVITLLEKLEQSEDFDEKAEYLKKLTEAKAEIAALQAEIDSINSDIKQKLYPFDKMGISDKKTVDGIVKRYNALSEYDRQKIERWEDVIKTKTRIDNMLRGIIIAAALCIIAAVISLLLIRRIKIRRRKREVEMEKLASLYSNE